MDGHWTRWTRRNLDDFLGEAVEWRSWTITCSVGSDRTIGANGKKEAGLAKYRLIELKQASIKVWLLSGPRFGSLNTRSIASLNLNLFSQTHPEGSHAQRSNRKVAIHVLIYDSIYEVQEKFEENCI